MPTSRGGAAAGVVDGIILVVGGEGNQQAPTGVFDAAKASIPPPTAGPRCRPCARHGTGQAPPAWTDGSTLPGGADHQAFSAVDTVEVYVLTP